MIAKIRQRDDTHGSHEQLRHGVPARLRINEGSVFYAESEANKVR